MTPHPPSTFKRALLPLTALLALAACGGGHKSSPPTADFSLAVSPASLSIPSGGGGYVTVTAYRLAGFTGPITVSLVGAPAGVFASGTIPTDASSLKLPIEVAPGIATQNLSSLSIDGVSGSLDHQVAFALTVAAALPPDNLSTESVQASGGRQTSAALDNQAFLGGPVRTITVKDAAGTTQVRPGFTPSGSPQNP